MPSPGKIPKGLTEKSPIEIEETAHVSLIAAPYKDVQLHKVPAFLVDAFNLLFFKKDSENKPWFQYEGIFRVEGRQKVIKTLWLPLHGYVGIPELCHVHDVCCLIKKFFRIVQKPLLGDLQDQFVQFGKTIFHEDTKIRAMMELSQVLPQAHRDTLCHLMRQLKKVTEASEFNKMDSSALAAVMAPAIFRNKDQFLHVPFQGGNPADLLFGAKNEAEDQKNVIQILIEHAQQIGRVSRIEQILSPSGFDSMLSEDDPRSPMHADAYGRPYNVGNKVSRGRQISNASRDRHQSTPLSSNGNLRMVPTKRTANEPTVSTSKRAEMSRNRNEMEGPESGGPTKEVRERPLSKYNFRNKKPRAKSVDNSLDGDLQNERSPNNKMYGSIGDTLNGAGMIEDEPPVLEAQSVYYVSKMRQATYTRAPAHPPKSIESRPGPMARLMTTFKKNLGVKDKASAQASLPPSSSSLVVPKTAAPPPSSRRRSRGNRSRSATSPHIVVPESLLHGLPGGYAEDSSNGTKVNSSSLLRKSSEVEDIEGSLGSPSKFAQGNSSELSDQNTDSLAVNVTPRSANSRKSNASNEPMTTIVDDEISFSTPATRLDFDYDSPRGGSRLSTAGSETSSRKSVASRVSFINSRASPNSPEKNDLETDLARISDCGLRSSPLVRGRRLSRSPLTSPVRSPKSILKNSDRSSTSPLKDGSNAPSNEGLRVSINLQFANSPTKRNPDSETMETNGDDTAAHSSPRKSRSSYPTRSPKSVTKSPSSVGDSNPVFSPSPERNSPNGAALRRSPRSAGAASASNGPSPKKPLAAASAIQMPGASPDRRRSSDLKSTESKVEPPFRVPNSPTNKNFRSTISFPPRKPSTDNTDNVRFRSRQGRGSTVPQPGHSAFRSARGNESNANETGEILDDDFAHSDERTAQILTQKDPAEGPSTSNDSSPYRERPSIAFIQNERRGLVKQMAGKFNTLPATIGEDFKKPAAPRRTVRRTVEKKESGSSRATAPKVAVTINSPKPGTPGRRAGGAAPQHSVSFPALKNVSKGPLKLKRLESARSPKSPVANNKRRLASKSFPAKYPRSPAPRKMEIKLTSSLNV